MDLTHVFKIFKGSLFEEDYRCDYVEIEKNIETYASETKGLSKEVEASVLLLKAILLILKGDNPGADVCLCSLRDSKSGFQARWQFRASSYGLFQLVMKVYPPQFRFAPRAQSIERSLSEVNMQISDKFTSIIQEAQQGLEDQMGLDRIEFQLILAIWHAVKLNCERLPRHSPQYARRSPPSTTSTGAERDSRCTSLATVREDEDIRVIGNSMGSFFYLVDNAMKHNIGEMDNQTTQSLHELACISSTNEDLAGQAMCIMTKADHDYGSIFSHPIGLNSILVFGSLSDLKTDFDKFETLIPGLDRETVLTPYDRAQKMFEDAGFVRGTAAALLRRACVTLLYGSPHHDTLESTIASAGILRRSHECFLRCQDIYACRVVEVHELLVKILLKESQKYEQKGLEIGLWAREQGNLYFGQFLGLLAIRFGRQKWLRHQATDTALRSFHLGLGVFKALDMHTTVSQIHTAMANILSSVNCFSEARIHFEYAYEMFTNKVFSAIRNAKQQSKYLRTTQAELNILQDLTDPMMTCYYDLDETFELQNFFVNFKNLLQQLPVSASDQAHLILSRDEPNLVTRIFKTKYRKLIREDNYQEACRLLDEFLGQPITETNPDRVIQVKGGRINTCFEYGRMRLARALLRELDEDHGAFEMAFTPDPSSEPVAWTGFGICINSYDYQRSRKFYDSVKRLNPAYFNTKAENRPHEDWSHLVNVALMHQLSAEWEDSLQYLLLCCQLAERHRNEIQDSDTRRASFGHSDVAKAFSWIVRACLHFESIQNYPSPRDFDRRLEEPTWGEQALNFAEKVKARSLCESISRRIRDKKRLLTEIEVREVFGLELDEAMERQKASLHGSSESKIERLAKSSLAASSSKFSRASGLYQNIDPDTIVIEMTLCHEGLALACVSQQGVHYAPWNPEFGIWQAQEQLSYYHQSIHEGAEGDITTLTKVIESLSKVLLEPLKEHIRRASSVIFVPTNYLARTPFAALLHDGQPLFLSKSVSQVPSLEVLRTLQQSASQRSGKTTPEVTVVAKPKFVRTKSGPDNPLPWASIEAMHVANTYGYNHVPQNGLHVTPESFRRLYEEADIFHVATHGVMNYKAPGQSYISLQVPLYVSDLTEYNSRATLVFFSICMSGLGHMTFADDMIGFSHMVLASGARAFIGSLWYADDMASFFLVYHFYKRLEETKRDSGSRVRLAEIWTRAQVDLYRLTKDAARVIINEMKAVCKKAKDHYDLEKFWTDSVGFLDDCEKHIPESFSHPFFWAPFIFVGYGAKVNS
ncbi:hypothetical protein GP486_005361 [Trichoglossum hirsutum]|uniref:CHAT domain-containing protein n=1 Tax=Trichoglossum hirsutum TaxID=265104 RepID=A0A9P8L9D5_9PEZI|nr:hypothetical protein GP486_005361 [Trichoglossum hirsutum]